MNSLLKIDISKLQKKEPLNTLRRKAWIQLATTFLNSKSPKEAGRELEKLLAKSTDNRTKLEYADKDLPRLFSCLHYGQSQLRGHVDSLSYLIAHATSGGYKTERLLLSAYYDGPSNLWWCFYLPSLYQDGMMLGQKMPSPSPLHQHDSGYNPQFILETYIKCSNIQSLIKNNHSKAQRKTNNSLSIPSTLWNNFRQPIMGLMASLDYLTSSSSCHSLQEIAYLHNDVSYNTSPNDQLIYDNCYETAISKLVRIVERTNFILCTISAEEVAHTAWEQVWHYATIVYPTEAPNICRYFNEISTTSEGPIEYKKIIIDYSTVKTGHKGHPIIDVEAAKQMRRSGRTLEEIGKQFDVTAEAIRKALLK